MTKEEREHIVRVYEEAMRTIGEERLDDAERLGRQLCGARFSGGWEVIALVHVKRGRADEALAALAEGTRLAPASVDPLGTSRRGAAKPWRRERSAGGLRPRHR